LTEVETVEDMLSYENVDGVLTQGFKYLGHSTVEPKLLSILVCSRSFNNEGGGRLLDGRPFTAA